MINVDNIMQRIRNAGKPYDENGDPKSGLQCRREVKPVVEQCFQEKADHVKKEYFEGTE